MSKSKGNVLDPLDIVDGIDLETLVAKRTSGMMQPKLAEKIAKQTRAEFPEGIASLRHRRPALHQPGAGLHRPRHQVRHGPRRGLPQLLQQAVERRQLRASRTPTARTAASNGEAVELSPVDRWIISALQRCEQDVTRHLDQFRFDLAAQSLYEFVWDEYCAWYLELVKPVLWDETASVERQRGTRRTLVRVLEVILRLAHPFMPFITEEIWQRIKALAGKEGPTLMLQPWPVANEARIDAAAEVDIAWVKDFMLGVRQIRGEMKISMAKRIDRGAGQRQRRGPAPPGRLRAADRQAGQAGVGARAGRLRGSAAGRHRAGRRDGGAGADGRADRQGRRAGAPGQGAASAWKARSSASAASWPTRASSPRRRPRCSTRSAPSWPRPKQALAKLVEQRARIAAL